MIDQSFDYIMVGGGLSGCALAHRSTTATSASALLLEAGPGMLPPMVRDASSWRLVLGSEYDWKYRIIRQVHPSEEADLHCLTRGIEPAHEIGMAAPTDNRRPREVAPGPEAGSMEALHRFVRQAVRTWYHPVGACKMDVDQAAVGDPEPRVTGVEGLRVADASIMPTIVWANTNAAALMIGWRGAGLIAGADAGRGSVSCVLMPAT